MAVYLVVNWSSLFTAVKHLFGGWKDTNDWKSSENWPSHLNIIPILSAWIIVIIELWIFSFLLMVSVSGGVCDCCLVGQLLDHFKLKSKCTDRPWFALRTHILAVTTESGNAKQSSVDPMGVGAKLPAFNDTSTEIRIDFYAYFAFNKAYTCHFTAAAIIQPVTAKGGHIYL